MELQKAYEIAYHLHGQLSPHCDKCNVAGSIRRGKEHVKDIEIVACPTPARYADFLAALRRYPIVKGKPDVKARYLKLQLAGIAADVFITTPARWGWTLILRTGSAEFNMRLLQHLKDAGYGLKDGDIWREGNIVPTPDEADVFALMGMEWVWPMDRTEHYRLAIAAASS